MPDYKEMYLKLFRAQAKAVDIIQEAHRECERIFMDSREPDIVLLQKPDKKEREPERDRDR